jgi:Pyruvate/2-oxoacid:ferredoxin oxidoreductase delta subunit
MSEIISQAALRQLLDAWLGQGRGVIAPLRIKPDLLLYAPLHAAADLLLEGYIRPANSIKETVFPRHEKLYGFRFHGKQVELVDASVPEQEQLVIGARPCDAAALPILDRVFNWDYKDEHYNRRRALTTVVTLACREHDRHCFCTSVGCGPDDPRGSDAMLYDLGDGTLEVRPLTEKGRALFAGRTQPSAATGQAGPGPEPWADLTAVGAFLARGFEDSHWAGWSARCQGCGACAFTCPTCHCFDMVDEGTSAGGAKVRNWDACQYTMFTMHASGHNPRGVQWQRQRQRVYHKFRTYPEKFGTPLCTGCGNCARNCPVRLGVLPVLQNIAACAAGAGSEK